MIRLLRSLRRLLDRTALKRAEDNAFATPDERDAITRTAEELGADTVAARSVAEGSMKDAERLADE